ncbi:MAG: deoxyuridine 5'-triphosphate nucleotidohydrolase [Clostridia bacterium]|nr:deoxyuridine 5'-triphosphate nucleotidohydrolase [Clostridia bacterium]
MKRIARFEKVSYPIFFAAAKDFVIERGLDLTEEDVRAAYDAIELPKRATSGSAGYDIGTPFALTLRPGESARIPTGIRSYMEEGWVLQLYPRSGLGFKYRLQLNNTVAIIDSDYYYSDNEGHLMVKITDDSKENKTLTLSPGQGFCQGIFYEYGVTFDDDASGVRNGGFGSTDKK